VGVIEKVGSAVASFRKGDTFDICQSILAPGGRLANVGVHGKPAQLRLEKL
jgi:alcohol dehydrogenase